MNRNRFHLRTSAECHVRGVTVTARTGQTGRGRFRGFRGLGGCGALVSAEVTLAATGQRMTSSGQFARVTLKCAALRRQHCFRQAIRETVPSAKAAIMVPAAQTVPEPIAADEPTSPAAVQAIRDYVAAPLFRSARIEELVIDDNPYRRPV